MEFPTPAVLFLVWFLLTPVARFLLWAFVKRMTWFPRLVLAHVGAYAVIVVATALALDAAGLAGMALLLAIGQGVYFVLDLMRARSPTGA